MSRFLAEQFLDRRDPVLGGRCTPLVERASVERHRAIEVTYPDEYRGILSLDVIHDGRCIPDEFLIDRHGGAIEEEALRERFIAERDWGASIIAARLAQHLGLGGFLRVGIARVLLDFGRFPGSTAWLASHLNRFAINFPFSELLSYRQKATLLERYYDGISREFEAALDGKLLKIAIHTYDTHNQSGTVRPPVSLLTRSVGIETHGEMPQGLFDPLYPDILGEFTADRVLRDRMSLLLEKSGIPVAHNYPYNLPEGSLEVRYQVWSFFRYVRRRFEEAHPDAIGDPAFRMVWEMLSDTNLRSSESEALRSHIHMFRRPPEDRRAEFETAEAAYTRVQRFLDADNRQVIDDYRFSPSRASSLAIEVRKDLIFDLDDAGWPIRYRPETVDVLTHAMADALATYLRDDRPLGTPQPFERRDPWYGTHPAKTPR
ncbi:MAG: hypothetical protein KC609_01430, partial [Myxococcales bacterium]|nr:hypothetical protein [Myxococcales bacterium]